MKVQQIEVFFKDQSGGKYHGEEYSTMIQGKLVLCDECEGTGTEALHGDAIPQKELSQWTDEEQDHYFNGAYGTKCETCKGTGRITIVTKDCYQDILDKGDKFLYFNDWS